MNPVATILITGAAGRIGRLLSARLARPDRTLRLLDRTPLPPAVATDSYVADVCDLDAMTAACRDVEAVVHLAGNPAEDTWQALLRSNVDGTRTVLEAARATQVNRVVLASSVHAAGYYTPADAPPAGLPADVTPRPDTYYGWTKAAMESLGRLYADRYDMRIISLRIGACLPVPEPDPRVLARWLSPDDCGRLVEAALTTRRPGFHIVWGVSRNTSGWLSSEAAREIGFDPQDDAQQHIPQLTNLPRTEPLGGHFCSFPLGQPVIR